MIGIRRILCPVDFSEFSRRALEYASVLTRTCQGKEACVRVFHVIPFVPSPASFPPYVSPVTLEPVDRGVLLEQLRRFAHEAAPNMSWDTGVVEGDVVGQILQAARELPADLIAMGTHGRGGFERFVLGSIAEKVLRRATCPVLTVGRALEGKGAATMKTILCPVDFSRSSLHALERGHALAVEAGARLVLLNVVEWLADEGPRTHPSFDVPEYRRYLEADARAKLEQALGKELPAVSAERIVKVGRAYEQILNVAREKDADMIVMGMHGRNVLDLMLFGSTTNHVVRGAPCAVMTMRADETSRGDR